MRVLLVGNYENDRLESMARFAGVMSRELRARGHEVAVARPAVILGRLWRSSQGWGKWLGYIDKYVIFPWFLRRAARLADVTHVCDHGIAPYARWTGATPSLVTCHDMLAVRGAMGEETQIPASPTGRLLQRWIVAGLRHADAVACVSSATLADFRRITGRNAHLVLNGLNYNYEPMPAEAVAAFARAAGLAPRRYLLHVGSNQPRKNRPAVLKVFAAAREHLPGLKLVLAGARPDAALKKLAAELGVNADMVETGSVGEESLRALYSGALALVFPSRFEGFGWPLVEAQACGTPVVCSTCAPFAEILNGTAPQFDGDDIAGMAGEIVRLARTASYFQAQAAAGLKNAERFTAAAMIRAYERVYETVVAKPQDVLVRRTDLADETPSRWLPKPGLRPF